MGDPVDNDLGTAELEPEARVPVGQMRLGFYLDLVTVGQNQFDQSSGQAPAAMGWSGDHPPDADTVALGDHAQSGHHKAV